MNNWEGNVCVVVVVVAVVIDSREARRAVVSEQAVDHRVGRPVALRIGGLRCGSIYTYTYPFHV